MANPWNMEHQQTMIRHFVIGITAWLLTASNSAALEIQHTPPLVSDNDQQTNATFTVIAPEATTVRLLATKAGFGIVTHELHPDTSTSAGEFSIALPIEGVIGNKYQFQARTASGIVSQSENYQIIGEADQTKRDKLAELEAELEILDRQIVSKRRALAVLKERSRELAFATDPLRAKARTLLNALPNVLPNILPNIESRHE